MTHVPGPPGLVDPPVAAEAGPSLVAVGITVRGAVQGTGFRPFSYRLAGSLGLAGSIHNTASGVLIHVEGSPAQVAAFRRRLPREAPPAAVLQGVEVEEVEPKGANGFAIEASETDGELSVAMLPDLATCPDCLRELFDPDDRRFGYPFLNCTACGPRLTIIEGLPYDRPLTAMRRFGLCGDCEREYTDPSDRRFHAQPVACPTCGPGLTYEGPAKGEGRPLSPLDAAASLIRAGRILALKGLGGYQLIVDARDGPAVARLRERKGREEKPFAVLFPSLEALRRIARVSDAEGRTLLSPSAPILLLPLLDGSALSDLVAAGLRTVGAMLPYSPLHHLFIARLGFPVVCTSGNLSEEPMATGEEEARTRLAGIADGFLHHDRPIVRHADDSVARVVDGALLVMRRARGFAPLPIPLRRELPTVRALGGHWKTSVAWSHGAQILVSQHVGDLDHPLSLRALERTVRDYERLYALRPRAVACDLHPDYATTRIALTSGLPVVRVQHHHAHIASALAEHDLEGEVLGVAWDGTGYGPDGTIWGGEFLRATRSGYHRVARLLPFSLPGGEAAARQPWRSALGALFEVQGEGIWEIPLAPVRRALPWAPVLSRLLGPGAPSVRTSSAGRLFDAVASLLDLRQDCSYEGQAAMLLEQGAEHLEHAASPGTVAAYPFTLQEGGGKSDGVPAVEVDWRPMIKAVIADLRHGVDRGEVAGRFHLTLARMIAAVAQWAGLPRVVLTGGCFQNALLTRLAAAELRARHFDVVLHCRIPPNDGGLSAGQALVAAHRLIEEGVP